MMKNCKDCQALCDNAGKNLKRKHCDGFDKIPTRVLMVDSLDKYPDRLEIIQRDTGATKTYYSA